MLFSIITICKDNLEELQKTQASVFSQDSKDFEWIVIDGNSSDGTRVWLAELNNQVNWVSEPDQGIYDAMNKGIRNASGTYLIFLNSGDEFENPNVLSKVSTTLEKLPEHPAFLYGDSIDVDEEYNLHYRKSKKLSFIKYGMITQHQAMFFNRHKIEGLTYSEDYKLSADYALISKVISTQDKENLYRLDFPVCRFQMGGLNESQRFRALKEDLHIRKNVMKLTGLESNFLYVLHYMHAVVKHAFKNARFLNHQKVQTQ